MHSLRRRWYVFTLLFALVFVLLGLLLGGRIVGKFVQTPRSARSLGSLTGGTPTPTARSLGSLVGATPTPTAGTEGSVASPTTDQSVGHLIIPTIGINASIEPVGVLADGDLAVPTQRPWDGVGWYQYGPQPGAKGSAVIDGHLDRPGGAPAVFWKLRNLHIGDIITVVNPGEKPLHFRVMIMKYYAPNKAPLKTIFKNMTGTFLNLITCAGQWIPTQHQTTLRLVIYTTLV